MIVNRRTFECTDYSINLYGPGCTLTLFPKSERIQPATIEQLASGLEALCRALDDGLTRARIGTFGGDITFTRVDNANRTDEPQMLQILSGTYTIHMPVHTARALLRDLEIMR